MLYLNKYGKSIRSETN